MLDEEFPISETRDVDHERLLFDWSTWARPEQFEPLGDWLTWLALAGRGWGKTRVGAEWFRMQAESGLVARGHLVGRTSSDVRDVMVEGESGILACAPPWARPRYEPSKRRLTWPNGFIATTFSADEPDLLRGPQCEVAWADEFASWRYVEAWDNLRFGLRLGKRPRMVVTTTPRPIPQLKELMTEPGTHVTRGTTYDNRRNLAPDFFKRIIRKYEGTRLGQQELEAHILDDTPGALWTQALIEGTRKKLAPQMKRIVVAIDPSVGDPDDNDDEKAIAECGIVVAGLGVDNHGYVLDDLSERLSPDAWARKAVGAYHKHKASRIVAEVNNGGKLVELTVRTVDANAAYRAVHAAQGKFARAEPVAALYEQGRVHHVGAFAQLESQMTTYVPARAKRSPDRMDALVWAITELMVEKKPAPSGMTGFATVGARESPNRIE